jgi:hypothetical protein
MKQKEPVWRDLGLEELMRAGPEGVEGGKVGGGGKGTGIGIGMGVGLSLRLKAGQAGRRGEGGGLPR